MRLGDGEEEHGTVRANFIEAPIKTIRAHVEHNITHDAYKCMYIVHICA